MSPPRPSVSPNTPSGPTVTPTKTPRTSLSPPDPNSRTREGRTPPPAPSAAYARRAREIMEDEGVVVPVVSVKDLGGEVVAPEEAEGVEVEVGFGGGYRRARAGTMPSKLQEADEITSSPNTPEGYVRTSALSPAYPVGSSPSRPSLRHATSSGTGIPTLADTRLNSPSNRPRSGSLGLPQHALGSAFGNSPFSKSWLANPSTAANTGGPARSPLHQNGTEELEDPQSPYSPDGVTGGSTGHLNFSTLDYLGLAEGNEHLSPASMAEVRNQAQKAIAQSGPASRLRANTVSNFARPLRQSVVEMTDDYGSPAQRRDQQTQSQGQGQGQGDQYSGSSLAGAMEHLAMYDAGLMGLDTPYGYKEPHRPRAITVGTLDNPRRGVTRSSYLSSIPQSPVGISGEYGAYPSLYNPLYGPPGGNMYGMPPRGTRSRDNSIGGRGPRMSISSHTSRAGTPDYDRGQGGGGGMGIGMGMNPQVPTRSLWIGNLDVGVTSDTLLQVFTGYGTIESVRMLPEKTCAFVNFIDKVEAVRARDDVLNRLGGHISALSETAPVRIGFGKIDSAPAGLNTSTIAAPPPGLVFTSGNVNVNPNPNVATAAISTPVPGPAPIPAYPTSPEQSMEQTSMPTRALYIGSIPAPTSSATLLQIFSPFGPVESARVLPHRFCGFINFERLDSAVSARNALNGRDILGSDIGPIRIGFARVPTKTPLIGGPETDLDLARSPERFGEALSTIQGAEAVSTQAQLSPSGGGVENYRSPLVIDLVKAGVHEQVLEKGLGTGADGLAVSEEQMIMQVLSAGWPGEDEDVRLAAIAGEHRAAAMYYSAIPVMGDAGAGQPYKRFDVGRLKEYRKRLESPEMSQQEVDGLALELIEDCAELAADHIGNTIIQKLFERVSYAIRIALLERVAPHLAMVGVHKNGTWAAQKIIECSVTEPERHIITSNLRPFAPPLMCDSLGNYVCAGTLKFGTPFSDYVFDAMADRMWDIAQNRFGARCMRTCLESVHCTGYQKKRISAGIILNAIPLSTNPNGALLLTWLVDQSNLPGRYGLLASRFAPHIAHLCTHKLASLTVLRIISQTSEPAASSSLLSSIFTSPADLTLIEVLSDANNGAQIIGKILATSTIPPDEKEKMVTAVRRVLPGIKATSTPPYRLLLEAVGLPVPPSAGPGMSPYGNSGRGASPNGPGGWQQQHSNGGNRYGGAGHMGQAGAGGYGMYQSNGGYANGGLAPHSGGGAGGHGGRGSPGGNSPRTPVPHHRGRLSPASQMMSPGSDPFNPFASPSIDMPYLQAHGQVRLTNGMPAMQFEQQPNFGGLGIMGSGSGQAAMGMYHQQSMSMYGRSGYQT